jgi:hypothetical protein
MTSPLLAYLDRRRPVTAEPPREVALAH